MRISFRQLKNKGYRVYCEGNRLVIIRKEEPVVEIIFDRKIMILTKEYAVCCDNNLEVCVKKGKYGYRIAIKTKSKAMKILYKGKWYRYKNLAIPFFPELPYITERLHM